MRKAFPLWIIPQSMQKYPKGKFLQYVTMRGHSGKKPRALTRRDSLAGKKNIVILGSSGSIGENALDIVRQFKDRFRVVGLSVNANVERLNTQAREFHPSAVAVGDASKAGQLDRRVRQEAKVLVSRQGVCALASLKEADLILIAIAGSEAIFPLLSAIRAKKNIALANKEALVIGGPLITQEARKNRVQIIPIDSEQNAIFQCLRGYELSMVENVFLTASGGPLVDYPKSRLKNVPLKQVLAHPRWKMGKKITVDSATLMNKGLEVIEAQHFFGLDITKIKVLIHRKALVHSMVEFVDGSILAQLGVTDMRLPIQVALSYPERWPNKRFRLDLLRVGELWFSRPDRDKFPCLDLAYEAARRGGTASCALNAANEVAVGAFLGGILGFGNIPLVIEKVLSKEKFPKKAITLDDIFRTDRNARSGAWRWVEFYRKKGCR
jgi:1-deoxy-D-xylulose-5-phosphate reductoisomerase